MTPRRAAPALFVLLLLLASLPSGVAPARADTVEEAEQQANEAGAQRDEAYAVVSESVANRDSIEAQLFDALSRYERTVEALEVANRKLDRVATSLAAAEATSEDVEQELRTQAIAAYMSAVLNPGSIVVGTDTVEQAMVVDQVFAEGQSDNLARLDTLTVRRADLERLRSDFQTELEQVDTLRTRLEGETTDLEALFTEADQEVAAAYRRAKEADEAYRSALTDVERARAVAAAPQPDPPTTTTSPPTPPTTDDPPSTTTTTITTAPPSTPPPGDPPDIRPEVERWRSLASQFFRSELVNDALLIIQCESNGDPNAVNPYSGAAGLFQFLPGTWAVAAVGAGYPEASAFDPEANIAAAAWLAGYYEANGSDPWSPWACRYYLP